jgi:hypothetical protein
MAVLLTRRGSRIEEVTSSREDQLSHVVSLFSTDLLPPTKLPLLAAQLCPFAGDKMKQVDEEVEVWGGGERAASFEGQRKRKTPRRPRSYVVSQREIMFEMKRWQALKLGSMKSGGWTQRRRRQKRGELKGGR